MTDHRRAQRGNVAGKMLLALIILAAFWGLFYWDLNIRDAGGDASDAVTDEEPGEDAPADDPDDDEPETPDEAPDDAPADVTDETGAVFSYLPVGDLLPESGPGFADDTVYRDILFPTAGRAYLNSQVYRYGGYYGALNGMEGGQCEAQNYEYPWQDTFCEKRSRDQDLCPGGGHEGLDIRPADCTKNAHLAVAAEDARVVDVRRHWVTLQTNDGTLYNYLHLNMGALNVSLGDYVSKGDPIGVISNDFYKSDGTSVPTTIHLHFEMYENYVTDGDDEPLFTKVNPYLTLVAAYDRKLRDE